MRCARPRPDPGGESGAGPGHCQHLHIVSNHYRLRSAVIGAVSILVANAHCRAQIAFGPSQTPALAAAARHVVTADFNGDQRADFAVASDASLLVLLSTCGGGYAAPIAIAPGLVLPDRGTLASGDLDGDGLVDLVAVRGGAQPTTGEVVFLRNTGGGAFAAPVVLPVLATPQAGQNVLPLAVTLGDLDGDGHLDVAAACVLPQVVGVPGYVAVAKGLAGGGLAPAVMLPTGQSFTNSIDLADMDLDGDTDIVVSNWADHSISIVLNDGTGTNGVVATERVGHATSALATRFAIGDVDGDGWPDVCVLRDNSVHPLLAIGPTNPRQAGFVRDVGITIFVGSQATPPSSVAADIALADLDGDGVLDLVAALTSPTSVGGGVVALRGLGAAQFGAEQSLSATHLAIDLAVADFDRDGDLDVAAAGGPPTDLLVCTNALRAPRWSDLGFALAGTVGTPCLDCLGTQLPGSNVHLRLVNVPAQVLGGFLASPFRWDLPIFGGVLVPDLVQGSILLLQTSAAGTLDYAFAWPSGLPAGMPLYWQSFALDAASPNTVCASNALRSTTP